MGFPRCHMSHRARGQDALGTAGETPALPTSCYEMLAFLTRLSHYCGVFGPDLVEDTDFAGLCIGILVHA